MGSPDLGYAWSLQTANAVFLSKHFALIIITFTSEYQAGAHPKKTEKKFKVAINTVDSE